MSGTNILTEELTPVFSFEQELLLKEKQHPSIALKHNTVTHVFEQLSSKTSIKDH